MEEINLDEKNKSNRKDVKYNGDLHGKITAYEIC